MANVNAERDDNHVPVALGVKSTNTTETTPFTINPVTGRLLVDMAGGGGGGTVDTVVGTADRITVDSTDPANPIVDIAATYVGQASITTVGTIATGVWNAGAVTSSGVITGEGFVPTSATTTGNRMYLPAANTLGWSINGSAELRLNASSLAPAVDSGLTLGTTVLGWADLNLASSAQIRVANNNWIGTFSSGILTVATGDLRVTNNFTNATSVATLAGAQALTNKSVNGVTLVTGGTATLYLSQDGTYTAPGVAVGAITGLGTGVAAALAINVGSAGAFVTFNGALGTPSSGTVTNLTGTASININGTVGATTPTTGVFTTLVAGSTTSLLLGTAGSAVGNIGFRNGTSGTITLAPVAGALGTVTLTLPAITDTIVTLTANQTLTTKTLTSPAITTGTYTGTQLLAEGASIGLDPVLSADGTWTGVTITGTSGYSQAFGDLVYLDPTDSRWEACDANSAAGADGDARGLIAMVVVAGTDGNACTLLLNGVIRADANFPSFTVNNPIYVSETAGDVTQTQPTTTDVVIRIVGAALTADSMYFSPDNTWITHT